MAGPPAEPAQARVLGVRLSALGDIVFALPALRALREARPEAHLAWLVEDRFTGLLEDYPGIDQLMVFPRRELRGLAAPLRLMRHLRMLRRSGRWDLVVDFQSNLKSVLQLTRLRAGTRAGYDKPVAREGAQRFYGVRARVEKRMHRSARDLALVAATGVLGTEPPTAEELVARPDPWPLPGPAMEAADALPEDVVLLHVTTTAFGQDKAWLGGRWAELARALRAQGLRPQALWTPADRPVVESVVSEAEGALEWAPATPSLAHMMALTDRAALLIGTDSGPAHLSARRGGRVVALFGATDPVIYAPPGPRATVVYAGEPGEPPPKRDRSRRAPWMDRIEVATVLDAAQRTLSR